ncbi:MAG: 2-hydroxy-3-oxopropionate reductase [Clostridiales bacterium]|nr:2-hydroxy-3-oxopropionate reductase [Clostridiales bacterium]
MKIGFIGLGIMGRPMAKNLLKAGYDLIVADKFAAEAVADVASCGAQAAASNKEVGAAADILITMVPNSPNVMEALFGEDGAAATLKPGTIVVDCSSISPIASREICAKLAAQDVEMLDAPVSGGEPKAIDGTLAFMVGGKQEVFDQCKPLLEKMGSSVVRCGDIGAGNVTKLCNQICVAVNIAALAEALTLGQLAGVEPESIFEAIKGGLAGSTVMNAKAPMMMDQNFKPGFRIDLHIKDLNNVVDTAKAVDSPIPLTQSTLEMMKILHRDGDGSLDHSALLKYYQKLTGEILHR